MVMHFWALPQEFATVTHNGPLIPFVIKLPQLTNIELVPCPAAIVIPVGTAHRASSWSEFDGIESGLGRKSIRKSLYSFVWRHLWSFADENAVDKANGVFGRATEKGRTGVGGCP